MKTYFKTQNSTIGYGGAGHSTTKQNQLLLIKTVPDHLKTVFFVIRLSVTIYNKTTINFDYFKNV